MEERKGRDSDVDLSGAVPPIAEGPSVLDAPVPHLLLPVDVQSHRPPPVSVARGDALPELPVSPTLFHRIEWWGRDYFLGRDPTFWTVLAPMLVLSLVLFTRDPRTNYIFDEQEALLANPYVNATNGLKYLDAIHRDFWGLPADRSVGSYRPIPNFLWRALWQISHQPFFHHIYNVVLHALNGAILTCIAFSWTRRRGLSFLAGFVFVSCAVLTEAVSGIVGIADVLGGLGALLALLALSLPAWAMPFSVFMAVLFGLFCKESALVCVPLVPFAAVIAAPLTHPVRPARAARAALALIGATAAFVLYVELRKKWFLSPLPSELKAALPNGASFLKRWSHEFLVWFHQAPLPKDPLNNPLAKAATPDRIAGALRVYWRGLGQIAFPQTLSGDYSFPQEPIPPKPFFFESVAGGAMMVFPPIASIALWIVAMQRERRARSLAEFGQPEPPESRYGVPSQDPGGQRHMLRLGAFLTVIAVVEVIVDRFILRPRGQLVAFRGVPLAVSAIPLALLGLGLVAEGLRPLVRADQPRSAVPLGRAGLVLVAIGLTWTVVSYFPHSNIPVVLPTVRAERFWYFPAIGTSLVIATLLTWLHESWRAKRVPWLGPVAVGAFLSFHALQAFRHRLDYSSDVDFWAATKEAVPNSAKAHLNYSVMKGARGDLPTRLTHSKIALALAPNWPMAHIYTGDTLCRMHQAEDAWPYYESGFEEGPNELSLIALALQCLYDEKQLKEHEDELRTLASDNEGTWIAYLATDTLDNHEKNKGVDPKYRPRGYNEGPRKDKE